MKSEENQKPNKKAMKKYYNIVFACQLVQHPYTRFDYDDEASFVPMAHQPNHITDGILIFVCLIRGLLL